MQIVYNLLGAIIIMISSFICGYNFAIRLHYQKILNITKLVIQERIKLKKAIREIEKINVN